VGGPARKLDITTDQWAAAGGLAGFRVSPDAHQITWVSGKKQDEIWALENFLPARKTAKARN
jgi:hypothetical protein